MTVGSAWNARMNPRDSSPISFFIPGERASRPNRNFVPAMELSSTRTTESLMTWNIFVPAGTRKMKTPNRSWSAVPQSTTRQLTTFRSDESAQATPIRMKMPKKLMILCIGILAFLTIRTG
jgi:hypothetical protein